MYQYSNSALEGGGWTAPRPNHFTLCKETRYTFFSRLIGAGLNRSGKSRTHWNPNPGSSSPYLVATPTTDYTISQDDQMDDKTQNGFAKTRSSNNNSNLHP